MIRNMLVIVSMLVFSAAAVAAGGTATGDRLFTISYGDVSTDYEDTGTDASGWRVNLSYETGKKGSNVLHGAVIGYIETDADVSVGSQTAHYRLKSLPVYYAPKFLFGQKAFKGFLKGALGLHFSDYKRSGALGDISTSDTGFYGGASLGAMFYFNQKVFANIEYEWAYLSNSYYRDGEVTSAMIGLGARF
jgi:hypothetical protein